MAVPHLTPSSLYHSFQLSLFVIPPPLHGEVTHSFSALQTSSPHTHSSPPICEVRPLLACSSTMSLCLNMMAVWDLFPLSN